MATRRGRELDGVLLLDKPEGLSSNKALQLARRMLDARKAGHTGTLDPFATGLLVCCFGKATKVAGAMLDADKGYRATLRFGVETDSGDLTGEPRSVAHADYAGPDPGELEKVLERFRGPISQIPPMHSALKRDGRPLYVYARQGLELERAPREVHIHALELVEASGLHARIDVHCSKGTYIRTLAQDIGRALGVGAHLVALRRTRVGPFDLDSAMGLDELRALENRDAALIPLDNLPAGLWPVRRKKDD